MIRLVGAVLVAFGSACLGLGAAADLGRRVRRLEAVSPRLELLVYFEPGQLSWALTALEQGGGGRRELSPCETLEETVELARERGAPGVHTLENGVERLVRL